jgi:uncharacterized protein
MLIRLIWPMDQIRHVARHGITPEEFEEVCFGKNHMMFRTKSRGPNRAYNFLGRTHAGRYLLCAIIQFPDGNAYPITARPMTVSEKQRFRKWSIR